MPPLDRKKDPYQAFNFHIQIDGIISGGFSECSGLEVETEVLEFREGGVNEYLHRFAGPSKHPPLVLKHGLMDSDALWSWHHQVVQGTVERKNFSIFLHDAQGQKVMRWDFKKAYPAKWTGPSLNANSGDVAVESLELVHHGFSMHLETS